MGNIRESAPVKLFIGILTSFPEIFPELEDRLAARFGPVDLRSEELPFDLTHYYDEEMGTPIQRSFLGFEGLVDPARISEIKRSTNDLESDIAARHYRVKRPVNLDPGYLEESKIVLASTKNFYHRIFLMEGIYGEVTLQYRNGRWEAFPWSFPDFRSGRYDGFFTSLRRRYREQLQAGRQGQK
jgi:hypothetical protein